MQDIKSELSLLIEEAYRVFPEQTFTRRLLVCGCNVCAPEDVEWTLRRTPRRELSGDLLRRYLHSVDLGDARRKAAEFRHFLPRLFELNVFPPSEPCYRAFAQPDGFARLGAELCRYRHNWRRDEVVVIDQLFEAMLRLRLSQVPAAYDRGDGIVIFEVLAAVERLLREISDAGGDIGRLLRVWHQDRSFAATCHIAATINHGARDWSAGGRPRKRLRLFSLWERRRRKEKRLVTWLTKRAQIARLDQAAQMAPDAVTADAIAKACDFVKALHRRKQSGK